MISFENITAIIFVLFLTLFLYCKRRKIKLIKILFPVLYVIQMKTAWGLHLMDRYGKKYRHHIQFLGFVGIGIGFFGMLVVSFSLVQNIWQLLFVKGAENGLQIVLPGTTVPGLGKLHFWHWIISIFILAVVHEFSHGVMAFAHNVKVKSSGAAIVGVGLPVLPVAFVEPDDKQLNKQNDIVKYSVFVAGPLSNLMLGSLLLLFMSLVIVPIGGSLSDQTGVSFIAIDNASFPAQSVFEDRTTVIEVNGKTTKDPQQFLHALECISPQQEVTFKDISNKEYSLQSVQHPQKEDRGFVGVTMIQQELEYKDQTWGIVYEWFRDLFKWLAALNIFIGIANLIPAGPLDGGLMLRTLLERLYERKKAHSISRRISIFLLIVILASFLLPWII